jgi:hypothetical protein
MKAQDADNTYSSDLWKKSCKSELQLIRQGDEGFLLIVLPLEWQQEQYHYMRLDMDTVAKRRKFLFQPQLFYTNWGKNSKQIDIGRRKEAVYRMDD